jgi:hypothetical protein
MVYMNGARALPLVMMIKTPKSNSRMISGNSQNFFRSLKNPHKSFKKSIVFLFSKVFRNLGPSTSGHEPQIRNHRSASTP